MSRAHYKEGDIHLFFSMYPIKPGEGEPMVLEVPRNIRLALGNDWSRCETVIRRVIDYLTSLDKSKVGRKYIAFVIDTSKVPKWLPTQIERFQIGQPYLAATLPTVDKWPLIVFGSITAFQHRFNFLGVRSSEATGFVLGVVGVALLGMLFHEICKRWMFYWSHSPIIFPSWTVRDTVRATFVPCARRYLITLGLSMLAINEGLG